MDHTRTHFRTYWVNWRPEDIMNLWRNHFSRLLNRPTLIDWTTANGLPWRSSFERYEIRNAILQLNNGKSADEDGLPAELFKFGGPVL